MATIEELKNLIEQQQEKIDSIEGELERIRDFPIRLDWDEKNTDTMTELLIQRFPDIVWDEIYYNSDFQTISVKLENPTPGEEVLDFNARLSDTSEGKNFLPNKRTRFRMSFYILEGVNNSTIYIASPGITRVTTIGTSISDDNKAYVGIKIINGKVNLVSYNYQDGQEVVIPTDFQIVDDTTYILEIEYFINYANIFIDGDEIGTIKCNLPMEDIGTYFPFITSVISDNNQGVDFTFESYEFLYFKHDK